MVQFVLKWNIHPDKVEAYTEWAQSTLTRIVSVGNVVELRGYRAATGSSQIVATLEFAHMGDWADWYRHDTVQDIFLELRTMATGVTTELWGPTPLTPKPIRPST